MALLLAGEAVTLLVFNLVLAGLGAALLALYFRFGLRLEIVEAILYAVLGTGLLTVVVLAIVYASYLF
jgi:hypothetical protein